MQIESQNISDHFRLTEIIHQLESNVIIKAYIIILNVMVLQNRDPTATADRVSNFDFTPLQIVKTLL